MERVGGYEPSDRGSTPLSCTRKFCLKNLIATSMRLQAVFIYRRGKSHDFPLLFFESRYLEIEVI